MRVLFISHTPLGRPGSASKYYFPAKLSELDFEVGLLGAYGGIADDVITNSDVTIFEGHWSGPVTRALYVNNIVKSFKPDIVHVFFHRGCVLYPILTTGKAIWLCDIRTPLLRTGLTGKAIRISNRIEVGPYRSVLAHNIESARTMIGNNIDIGLLSPGIDLNAIPDCQRDTKQSSADATFRLLYIGSLDKRRQLLPMLEAVKLLLTKISISLDIYGEGDDEYNLIKWTKINQLDKKIHFNGIVKREHLYKLMCQYDIGLGYVGPEIYQYAPALKVLEYLASGLPVVATDTPGNRLFVRTGINGILTEHSANAFADGIFQIFQQITNSGFNKTIRASVEQFDWQRIITNRLLPEYSNLLKDYT